MLGAYARYFTLFNTFYGFYGGCFWGVAKAPKLQVQLEIVMKITGRNKEELPIVVRGECHIGEAFEKSIALFTSLSGRRWKPFVERKRRRRFKPQRYYNSVPYRLTSCQVQELNL